MAQSLAYLEEGPEEGSQPVVASSGNGSSFRKTLLSLWWIFPVFLAAALLSFLNLGTTTLWSDEAHVAIMARNFLTQGEMTGWSGRNLYGFMNGGALDANLRPLNAPLDIWVCAASFHLFGMTEWAGRLPFALAGLAAAVLFARLIWLESRRDPVLTFFAVSSLSLSTAWLLYLRQCRYYSFSALGTVVMLYGYRRFLADRRPAHALLLAAGAAVHFYANPMTCAVVLLALAGMHIVLRPGRWDRREWLGLLGSGWLFLVATLPYAVYYRIWERPDHNYVNDTWLVNNAKLLWRNLREMVWATPLTWLVLPVVVWGLWKPGAGGDRIGRLGREWAVLVLFYVFFLALLSPQTTIAGLPADVRYQIPIYPTLAALAGFALWRLARASRLAAVALFALNLTCVPWTFHPFIPGFQWLLPGLVKEVAQPYPTAAEAVTDYLRANARPDDSLFSAPEYMNYPVEFMIGDRIYLAGMLRPNTHLPAASLEKLPSRVWEANADPDWVVAYGVMDYTTEKVNPILERRQNGKKKYQLSAVLPYYRRETHRPELTDHTFGPMTGFDPKLDGVWIFRKQPD